MHSFKGTRQQTNSCFPGKWTRASRRRSAKWRRIRTRARDTRRIPRRRRRRARLSSSPSSKGETFILALTMYCHFCSCPVSNPIGYERFMNRESRNRFQFRVLGGIGIDFSRFWNRYPVLAIPFCKRIVNWQFKKKESSTA